MKKFLSFITLFLFAIVLVACGNDPGTDTQDDDKKVTYELSIAEKDKTIELEEGSEVTITPTYTEGATLVWTTNSNAVATVENGTIKGIKEGSTQIVVSMKEDLSKVITINVTVKAKEPEKPKTYTLTLEGSSTVVLGETITLTPKLSPALEGAKYTWEVDNSKIATVDKDGKVKGVKYGTAKITCLLVREDGGDKTEATFDVTVVTPTLNKITISGENAVAMGSTTQLTYKLDPTKAIADITWSSSDENIATIDADGKVTGIKAGEVTITCTGKQTDLGVEVKQEFAMTVTSANPSKVTVGCATNSVAIDGTATFTATFEPAGCLETKTWKVDYPYLASIDADGVLTGLAAGTVTVYCYSADENVYGTKTITIEAPTATDVTIFGLNELNVGETSAYKALTTSVQANQEFTWTTSDANVITVDASGTVTAVAAGTANLVATVTGTTVKYEKAITVNNAITYTEIVIDPSLTSTTAGTTITVEEKQYVFGTTIFASLATANIQNNTHIILMQGDYAAYQLTASNIKITACVDNVVTLTGILTLGDGVHDVIIDGINVTGEIDGTDNNKNIIIQNCTMDKAAEHTIYFTKYIENLQVLNCNFINVTAARTIRFESGTLNGFIVDGCTFEGSGNYDYIRGISGFVPCGYIRISNCKFNGSNQSAVQFSSMGSAYIEVVGNEFYDIKNTAVDMRINSVGPFIGAFNISYNVFDNTNVPIIDSDTTWGCIRLRFNNYTEDTVKVTCNYNKFINWNDGNVPNVFNDASSTTGEGYFKYHLANFENNYYSYDEVNDDTFEDCACVYSAISASEVDKAIALYNLDSTGEEVKLVGTSAEFTKEKYATLASAIDAANEGDIIYLLPGTYNENITITKNNLTIRSLLYGENPANMANDAKKATYTGTITLGSKLKGLTIDGLYFTGTAQILNQKGVAGTAQDTDTNIDVFNFINNYVASALQSGNGFMYFIEESSSYSHNITIDNNYFDGTNLKTTAYVYLDNCYDLVVSNNVFNNINSKAFYINDTTKGLSGQYDAFVSNTFSNCKNGLWINWMSPLPLNTETAEVYIVNNNFYNITEKALYVGQMNNTDVYKTLNVQYNTFESVATAIHFNRVTSICNLNANYNVFKDVPSLAYYVSAQVSSATLGSIDASFNAFMDGNGNYIEPAANKFSIESAASAPIILDNRCESDEDLFEFVELANEIELIVPEDLYAGQDMEVEINFYPTDAFYQDVEYVIEDETILTIENGMIKPLRSGTTTVTAIYKKNTAIKSTATYTVKEYNVLELRYEGNGILKANDTVQLTATVENVSDGTRLVWSSSSDAIATVDQNGLVTAVGTGIVTITCKIDGVAKTATCGFSVVDDTSLANNLLKLLVEANNGVIMYEKINYIGYESGCESLPHYVYGSANKYYAGVNPTIVQMPMPSTNQNTGWVERTDGIKLITVHDTGSAASTSTALANAKWCNNSTNTNTSWHYTIGNDGIYQQLDDKYVAWHAGDGSETSSGLIDTGVVATVPGKRATVTIDEGYYVVNGTKTTCEAPKGPEGETLTTADIVDSGIVTIIGDNNHYYINTYYNSTYKKIASYGGYSSIGIETAVNKGSDVYLTWQRTAKFVASKLVQYNLTLDRMVYHNNLSGKNCPQTMRTANKCSMFEEMVAIEYEIAKNYSDYTITFTSSNPSVLDNTGRVVGNGPRETTQVNYTITVTNGSITASQECSVLVIGTRNAK